MVPNVVASISMVVILIPVSGRGSNALTPAQQNQLARCHRWFRLPDRLHEDEGGREGGRPRGSGLNSCSPLYTTPGRRAYAYLIRDCDEEKCLQNRRFRLS